MIPPRYRKLTRDIWLARTRTLMMVAAIAVSLAAVGAVLSVRGILQREMSRNYLGTNPASATLEMSRGLTPAQLADIRDHPGVTGAAVRRSLQTRMATSDGQWHQLLLFVIADNDPRTVSHFDLESGSWPPASGGMLAERSTMSYFGLTSGDTVQIRGPRGQPRQVTITGTVHDAAVAPSQQETVGYGYVTPALLESLGEESTLDDLKITVGDGQAIEFIAQRIAASLASQGIKVDRIQIPPAKQHPHQTQMDTVVTLLLLFGLMAFVLSTILMATMLGSMLAQQIRQIAVMKVVGARTSQIFSLYLLMTLLIAVTATALSVPPALWLARMMSSLMAGLLNLDIASFAPPAWIIVTQVAAGLTVPLLIASVPLWRASQISVRDAMDDHGVAVAATTSRLRVAHRGISPSRSLSMAWRNMFRRRGRLALSLLLLTAAGALFITSLNTAAGWSELSTTGTASRHYDLEVRLDRPVDAAALTAAAAGVPGVGHAEAWLSVPAEVTNPGSVPVARVYPDGGHGSFSLVTLPASTSLITPTVQSGRWLLPGDTNAVVVNQLLPGAVVGQDLTLTANGVATTWRIVGTVADFGSQGSAYVNNTTGKGANLIRVAAGTTGDTGLAARVEKALVANGYGIRAVLAVSQLAEALDGHVAVLIMNLLAIAIVLAAVGLLGLASTMSTSVIERTREFAVMKAVGATPGAIQRIVISEGVMTVALSLAAAIAGALPLTVYLGDFVGRQAFRLPLPLHFSGAAVLLWTVAAMAGGVLACLAAARRAGQLTIREALTTI
jgi:putative ABC transport system permease protein